MKRTIAILLVLVMSVAVLASCGGPDNDDKGAYINMYLASYVSNFDPQLVMYDEDMVKFMGLLF